MVKLFFTISLLVITICFTFVSHELGTQLAMAQIAYEMADNN